MTNQSTTISQGGRVVIPAELRKQLGWEEGQEVVLRADEHGVYITTPQQAWKALLGCLESKDSMVEALFAERRRDASTD